MSAAGPPLAAVTGGTGFVGRHIVAALSAAGWRLRLLVRRDPIHAQIPELDAEIVLGDLSDPDALARLCAGADAVIHAAGAIKARDRAGFVAANVEGSAALARAATQAAPAARLVVLSSLAARAPELSDYAASKRAGEAALADHASGPVVILRPSAIYGRWDRETLPLFRMARRGMVLAPQSAAARVGLIHVRDVARAALALATAGPRQAVYELTDETTSGYAWREIAEAAGKALETRPCLVPLPPAVVRAAALGSQAAHRLAGRTPILTLGKAREILHGDWGSSLANQPPRDLWRPGIALNAGFSDTARWYRHRNWL